MLNTSHWSASLLMFFSTFPLAHPNCSNTLSFCFSEGEFGMSSALSPIVTILNNVFIIYSILSWANFDLIMWYLSSCKILLLCILQNRICISTIYWAFRITQCNFESWVQGVDWLGERKCKVVKHLEYSRGWKTQVLTYFDVSQNNSNMSPSGISLPQGLQ